MEGFAGSVDLSDQFGIGLFAMRIEKLVKILQTASKSIVSTQSIDHLDELPIFVPQVPIRAHEF